MFSFTVSPTMESYPSTNNCSAVYLLEWKDNLFASKLGQRRNEIKFDIVFPFVSRNWILQYGRKSWLKIFIIHKPRLIPFALGTFNTFIACWFYCCSYASDHNLMYFVSRDILTTYIEYCRCPLNWKCSLTYESMPLWSHFLLKYLYFIIVIYHILVCCLWWFALLRRNAFSEIWHVQYSLHLIDDYSMKPECTALW